MEPRGREKGMIRSRDLDMHVRLGASTALTFSHINNLIHNHNRRTWDSPCVPPRDLEDAGAP
jgi:hypothetical protein